jgi:hypothetical protein
VLIAGGRSDANGFLGSAEIFDPATETFTATGSMAVPREYATAVTLGDGRVLIAGGRKENNKSLASAEVFDPSTEEFSPVSGAMTVARHSAAGGLLPGGSVLLAGGDEPAAPSVPEVFDPTTESFESTGTALPESSYGPGAPLADGSILDVGLKQLFRYDPATGTFSTLSLKSRERTGVAAAPLPGGRVLVAGGFKIAQSGASGPDLTEEAWIFVSSPSPQSSGLDFGEVPAGSISGPEALTVTNRGAQDLEVEAAALTGPDATKFAIAEDQCSGETLAFGESCDVLITVTPSAPGSLTAALTLADNAPGSPHGFALAADAVEPPPRPGAGGVQETPPHDDGGWLPGPGPKKPKPPCRQAKKAAGKKRDGARHARRGCARPARGHHRTARHGS